MILLLFVALLIAVAPSVLLAATWAIERRLGAPRWYVHSLLNVLPIAWSIYETGKDYHYRHGPNELWFIAVFVPAAAVTYAFVAPRVVKPETQSFAVARVVIALAYVAVFIYLLLS